MKLSNLAKEVFEEEESIRKKQPEDQGLFEEARQAELRKKISQAELAAYKVEQEKINLEKLSQNLAEFSFMEYLFIGYMERINIEMVNMAKKIKPLLASPCKEGNLNKVIEIGEMNKNISNN